MTIKLVKTFRKNASALVFIAAACALTGPNPADAQVSLELVAGGRGMFHLRHRQVDIFPPVHGRG